VHETDVTAGSRDVSTEQSPAVQPIELIRGGGLRSDRSECIHWTSHNAVERRFPLGHTALAQANGLRYGDAVPILLTQPASFLTTGRKGSITVL
jgi:hypothetical protein